MQQPVRVSLVIPVHDRKDTTLQCLRSLSRIDTAGLDVHIVVVDDGSTDGTSDAIHIEFPDVELIRGDGTLHYAGGTNAGIEAALGKEPDHIVLMNDDSVFHESFLRSLVNAATNSRSVVGALLLLWDEPHRVFQVSPRWSAWQGGWTFPAGLTAFDFGDAPFEVECLVGNCVLVPAAAIRECGLMDARRFPFGWGDAQYFARLKRSGWELMVDPNALIWCEPNTYPSPVRNVPFRKRVRILLRDRRHPQNLQRVFIALWESAPSKVQAAAAFCVYCLRLAGKAFRTTRPK